MLLLQYHIYKDCYYEPWTNCTIQDALGDKTVYQLITENGGYLHPNGRLFIILLCT